MQTILYTTETRLIGEHEALFFNDGHLEIEGVQEAQETEQVCLSEDEQYKLYLLLHVKYSTK